jgi:hypothetical protein
MHVVLPVSSSSYTVASYPLSFKLTSAQLLSSNSHKMVSYLERVTYDSGVRPKVSFDSMTVPVFNSRVITIS